MLLEVQLVLVLMLLPECSEASPVLDNNIAGVLLSDRFSINNSYFFFTCLLKHLLSATFLSQSLLFETFLLKPLLFDNFPIEIFLVTPPLFPHLSIEVSIFCQFLITFLLKCNCAVLLESAIADC